MMDYLFFTSVTPFLEVKLWHWPPVRIWRLAALDCQSQLSKIQKSLCLVRVLALQPKTTRLCFFSGRFVAAH